MTPRIRDRALRRAPRFVEVDLDHPFLEEVDLMAITGISGGHDDGTHRPAVDVTRQAMAAFLVRSCQRGDVAP